MGILRVQMKEILPWLVLWVIHAGKRDFCSVPWLPLVGPVQSIFSSPYTISIFLSPSVAQQARQAAVLGRLSLSMCLWVEGGLNENYAQGFFIGILLPPANTARMSTNLILLRWLTLTLFLLPVYQSCRR
jgi:hypothetical protein